MTVPSDRRSQISKASHQWYASAVLTALVGSVFSLIILVLLVSNFIRTSIVQARREHELINMKIEIQNRPDDEQFLVEIRKQDLQFRQNLFRSVDFTRKGAYLLLAGVVIMLVGIKSASTLKKKKPVLQPGADRLKEQVSEAKFSRFAVTAGLCLLGISALLLAIKPGIAFYDTFMVDMTYPSAEEISKNWFC